MRPDTITLAIEEKYSPEEREEIAGKLATGIADLMTIKGEKKASDAAFNERITKCEEEVKNLARRYNKGCEVAQIGCDIRYDHPEAGKKSYVRMDTGELVQTHDMTWEEKQETLQFPLTQKPEDAAQAQPTDQQVNETLDSLSTTPADEEVTKLCPYPGCILFAEHDGAHEFPAEESPEAGDGASA